MFALHFYCCLHLVAKRMCFSASSGKEDKKGCRQVQCVYHQHVFIKSHCKMQRTVLKTNWITNKSPIKLSIMIYDSLEWVTQRSSRPQWTCWPYSSVLPPTRPWRKSCHIIMDPGHEGTLKLTHIIGSTLLNECHVFYMYLLLSDDCL